MIFWESAYLVFVHKDKMWSRVNKDSIKTTDLKLSYLYHLICTYNLSSNQWHEKVYFCSNFNPAFSYFLYQFSNKVLKKIYIFTSKTKILRCFFIQDEFIFPLASLCQNKFVWINTRLTISFYNFKSTHNIIYFSLRPSTRFIRFESTR